MRINTEWLVGSLIVGSILGYGWYSNPRELKMWLIIIAACIALYGIVFIVDKIFYFQGQEGRGVMTFFLLWGTLDIMDEGLKRSIGTLLFMGVCLIAYIVIRLKVTVKEREKRQ